jgi:DNA-binding response OmpR family regulator
MSSSVLVIESNPRLREMIRSVLCDKGLEVIAVGSVGQAEMALVDHMPKVIVLDAEAPDGDAKAFCASLRHEGLRVPVILTSVRSDEDDVVRGLEAGADDYLVKPFGTGELAARVAGQLRHTRLHTPASHLAA